MSFCSFFGGEVFQNHFEPGLLRRVKEIIVKSGSPGLWHRLRTAKCIYVCAQCGYELFSSRSKYAHSSPWPAFTETIHADSVAKRPEHNQPGALKAKKLLPPRDSRWAAHTQPRWTLLCGHTLDIPP
ncbi:methionine-R-sulfoxide reductase B1 isoform X1 [Orcinus orca]|uniref:methionine-R-sulfoxide reductase B1 isoform X1 n=1 Tax=Orcinus orca TaxID=9733 RepID=UPI001441D8DC|nr:methionine-R-sulfoxide reductase B1 isoform X1 [Orcinus orca]